MRAILLLDDPLPDRARLADELRARGFEACWPEAPAREVEALLTVTQPVSAELLEAHPALKLVCVAFTGFDHVDREGCRARGISVCNVPEYATAATAELALGLALALLRGIPRADRRLHALEWRPQAGGELRGRTVGILGTGRIGCHAARLFQAFGARVIGWSRRASAEFEELGGTRVEALGELLAASDLVSLHLPLTEQTRGILGAGELARMRQAALLVNVARGALVDAQALHAALRKGAIGGAALDVYEREPFAGDPPFQELENVILLPHLGFRTREALAQRWSVTLENLGGFFRGQARNLVA
ncbi:MAG: hydroxyacid dehydrogenase [Planctomycetes bacterium]|nr:hydroxyacid dehydrogenase [Planctomycetota bacterium]